MGNKWDVKPEQAEVLVELEKIIGKRIPVVDEVKLFTVGVIIRNENVIEMGLHAYRLTTLPDSLSNLGLLQSLNLSFNGLKVFPDILFALKLLQRLDLSRNKLQTLPESLKDLSSLKILNLNENRFTSLSESIGDLKHLQTLQLVRNQLTTLPESIGNLSSLQDLILNGNQLTELPVSLWKLGKLKSLSLYDNPWEGEWKEIAERDVIAIREFCKQRAAITIFVSHTVNEFVKYRIKDIAEYLENQPEIDQVYFCEESLKGNIDAWMEETVPKSHLLLFIGTQQSIYKSEDCSKELFLARKYNIEVTPIKGVDASWEDLTKVGLSRELGFEYNDKRFSMLCADLYAYICKFKVEKDLLNKEQGSINKIKSEIRSIINEMFYSEYYNVAFAENSSKIEELKREYKSQKISFTEFLRRLTAMLE